MGTSNGLSTIERTKVVIGEGNAEAELCAALIDAHQITGVQALKPQGGNSKIKPTLEAYAVQFDKAGVETVVIVLDNDDDPPGMLSLAQDAIATANGLNFPVPASTWVLQAGTPSVAIIDLPAQGQQGTVETLIWPALENAFKPEDQHILDLMTKVRTGTNKKLTTREKAKVSAMLSSTCTDDPSCMVHWMWQSKKGYAALLHDPTFTPLVNFLKSL